MLRIGTAGWTIRREHVDTFAPGGTHLQRYARRFNAVEINSSFYRPHRRTTYARWAASVPENFRFSVKLPRAITHELRLVDAATALDAFRGETSGLGEKLGILLVQLPPSFAFDADITLTFFTALRARFAGHIALEPRHTSWFTPLVEGLLIEHRIARVAADPAIIPAAAEPGGWPGLSYFRLHGAPRMYYSAYAPDEIARYAEKLRQAKGERWCIFDNTARGAATRDALALLGVTCRAAHRTASLIPPRRR